MAKTTVEFNESASEKLEALSKELGTSKAEVLRDALSLYGFLAEGLGGNEDLAIVGKEDKEIKKVVFVPHLARRAV